MLPVTAQTILQSRFSDTLSRVMKYGNWCSSLCLFYYFVLMQQHMYESDCHIVLFTILMNVDVDGNCLHFVKNVYMHNILMYLVLNYAFHTFFL